MPGVPDDRITIFSAKRRTVRMQYNQVGGPIDRDLLSGGCENVANETNEMLSDENCTYNVDTKVRLSMFRIDTS